MAPVSRRLAELTGAAVQQAPAVVGERGRALAARGSAPGEVLVLENSRFEPGETSNDPELARGAGARWRSSTSTTPSAPRTARTPPPRASRSELPAGGRLPARARGDRARSRSSQRPGAAVRGRARRSEGERQDRRDRALPRARRRDPDRRRDVLQLLPRPGQADGRLARRGGGRRGGAASCSSGPRQRAAGSSCRATS